MAGSAIWKPMIGNFADIFASDMHGYPGIASKWCSTSSLSEITVFFEATDSAYAEVQRVLQIMIPEIILS